MAIIAQNIGERDEADFLRATERERLGALVEANRDVAYQLHAEDFQLITPGELALKSAISRESFLRRY